MIEVGDMILYEDTKGIFGLDATDIGWVVHTETHHRSDGLVNLIVIKWLGDVKNFHKELKDGAFVSEYAFVSASYENGEPLLVVQDVETGEV